MKNESAIGYMHGFDYTSMESLARSYRLSGASIHELCKINAIQSKNVHRIDLECMWTNLSQLFKPSNDPVRTNPFHFSTITHLRENFIKVASESLLPFQL